MKITDAHYMFNDSNITTPEITIDMRDSKSGRVFTLESEFADVVMNLSGSPSSNFAYLHNALADYLPALYNKNRSYSPESLYGFEGVKLDETKSNTSKKNSNSNRLAAIIYR